MKVLILLVGLAVSQSVARDCWWTGCQPNDWAEVGCEQYDREEKGRKPCVDGRGEDGFRYYCCDDSKVLTNVTNDQFSKAITSNGYPAPSYEQFYNFMNNAAKIGRISSKQELAMALAQMLYESDGLRSKKEYPCAKSQCSNEYLTPGCDAPGQYYYGRGYIRLTGCNNYKQASQDLFGDYRLVNDPDSVARDDALAWKTAFWYWGIMVHDAAGVQRGQFGASTKAINGATECSAPRHPTPAKRFNIYSTVRAAFGLESAGDQSGCA